MPVAATSLKSAALAADRRASYSAVVPQSGGVGRPPTRAVPAPAPAPAPAAPAPTPAPAPAPAPALALVPLLLAAAASSAGADGVGGEASSPVLPGEDASPILWRLRDVELSGRLHIHPRDNQEHLRDTAQAWVMP